jgi:hypothetical protein
MVMMDAWQWHGIRMTMCVCMAATWKGMCSAMRITSAGTVPCATAMAPPIMCRI